MSTTSFSSEPISSFVAMEKTSPEITIEDNNIEKRVTKRKSLTECEENPRKRMETEPDSGEEDVHEKYPEEDNHTESLAQEEEDDDQLLTTSTSRRIMEEMTPGSTRFVRSTPKGVIRRRETRIALYVDPALQHVQLPTLPQPYEFIKAENIWPTLCCCAVVYVVDTALKTEDLPPLPSVQITVDEEDEMWLKEFPNLPETSHLRKALNTFVRDLCTDIC